MKVDELQRRDARIAELEAIGRRRTRDQDHELARELKRRDYRWQCIPRQVERARTPRRRSRRLRPPDRASPFTTSHGVAAMLRVNNWSAIRSGATMTVTGTDADSAQKVRLTGVEYVGSGSTPGGKVLVVREGRPIAELVA